MYSMTMFWILVLSVTALCAPVAKDPVDLPSEEAEGIHRQTISLFIDNFVRNKTNVVRAKLNKNNVDNVFGMLKSLRSTRVNVASNIDQTRLTEQGRIESKFKLQDRILPDSHGTWDDCEHAGDQRKAVNRKKEVDNTLSKFAKDIPRQIPKHSTETMDSVKDETVVDVTLDLEVGKDFVSYGSSLLKLKEFYEKKGGICTLINGYRNVPIYVISACRSIVVHSNIRSLCEHPRSSRTFQGENTIDIVRTPVQDEDGFVYRNVYCAQCNGKENVQAWYTKLDCYDYQPLSFTDGLDELVLLGSTAESSKKCVRQLQPAVKKMLHECSPSEYVIDTSGPLHQTRTGEQGTDMSPFPLSFSILMNFGFDGKTHILFSTDETNSEMSSLCGDNRIYDSENAKCREISCNSGYHLVEGGVCRKDESYDNMEDITNLSDTDIVQVNLTIRNVTYDDLLLLCLTGSEQGIVMELGRELNISQDRIQNMTINVVNSTDGPSSSYVEIHYFATPFLQRERYKQTNFSSKPFHPAYDEKSYPTTTKKKHPPKSNPKINEKFLTDTAEAMFLVDDTSESDTHFDKMNGTIKTKGKSNASDSEYNSSPSNISHTRSGYYNANATFENNTNDIFDQPLNLSIQISFILLPARKNISESENEKSVGNVLEYMNYLTRSSSFSITLNGTNLMVDNMLRAPDPSSMDEFCKYGERQYVDIDDFIVNTTETKGIVVTTIYVNATGHTYYPKMYDLTLVVEGIVGNLNDTQETGFAFVCDMPKITDETCTGIVLNGTEYTYFPNKSIMFASRLYSFDDYEYINEAVGTIRVCAPKIWTLRKLPDDTKMVCGDDMFDITIAEAYLTYILGVISLVAMLAVLITYSLFDKLRNLPGVNTMNLTLSIFLGEFIFLVSGWLKPEDDWLCSAVAMLLHYLFLASFFWMNVMSYDVYKTFARKCILRRVRDKKKYMPRYSLYAWGSPLVIVCICALIDFSDQFDGLEVKYGGLSTISNDDTEYKSLNGTVPKKIVHNTQGCWIQNPVASLTAFGGPLLAIILSNAVMFTRTIMCIRASTNMIRKSLKHASIRHMSGQDDVMLYVRMSTVMGSTWIFGLASSAGSAFVRDPGNIECIILHVVQILFIGFNCSVGMFIFFTFIFSRRVLALYKGLYHNTSRSRNRHLSTSSKGTLTSQLSQSSVTVISIKQLETL